MKYDAQTCELVAKGKLSSDVFDFKVKNDFFASLAQPGQFAHVLVKGKTLRRPISICDADKKQGTLRLVFQVRGEGTSILSETPENAQIDIIAPLGHGFTIGDTSKKAVFVGGGIGVPPLLYAAKLYGANATVVIGFRNKDAVILEDDFKAAGCRVLLSTDDGSAGIHGFVTQSLQSVLENDIDTVYACGPTPMLKAVARMAEEKNIACQVSLEERMACGVGACLGCACKAKSLNGEEVFKHVCKDGPVFNSREVVW